jgi:L-lysine 2,3-aminomutase
LKVYLEPLLAPEFDHIKSIRIGTKSVAYWPYKYVTDKDARGILKLFEEIVNAGKHLAIMGHYNHWKELSTEVSHEAIRRIRNTGAQIRTQSPLIKHINDDPEVWAKMWKDQVNLGCIPYYFFIERNTGAKNYFEVPIERAYNIYRDAYMQVSGLSRTVRGPSMSALPGKIAVEGIAEIKGEKVFVLTLLQARNPEWCKKPFFAKYDPKATWYDQLKPAFGENKFFFIDELNQILASQNGQIYFGNEIEEIELEEDSEMVA